MFYVGSLRLSDESYPSNVQNVLFWQLMQIRNVLFCLAPSTLTLGFRSTKVEQTMRCKQWRSFKILITYINGFYEYSKLSLLKLWYCLHYNSNLRKIGRFRLPRASTHFFQKPLIFIGPKFCNCLPNNLKQTQTPGVFNKSVKKWLFLSLAQI